MKTNINIDATNLVNESDDFLLGSNIASWDNALSSDVGVVDSVTRPNTGTVEQLNKLGANTLRISNGAGANNWHFNSDDGAGLLANLTATVKAQGIVTINFGTGTPKEAAAYVAYLNGKPDDSTLLGTDSGGDWKNVGYWANLRGETPIGGEPLDGLRANHPESYNFLYFEIGNEIYFSGADPFKYVEFAKEFFDIAKSITPEIKIGLGLGNPIEYDETWNIPVLKACSQYGLTPGFISDHFYIFDGHLDTLPDEELLLNTVNNPASEMPDYHSNSPRNWQKRAELFRNLIQTHLIRDDRSKVKLICAEFNTDADAINKQSTNLVRGLLIADAVGAILQTEFSGLIYWTLRNSYEKIPDDPAFYGWRTGKDEGLLGESVNNSV